MLRKLVAEGPGTLMLVLFGCGAAVIAGANGETGIGLTGIALAFGLAIVAAACGPGAISGAHLNPAVSPGMVTAGRMSMTEALGHMLARIAGAVIGAAILYAITSGIAGYRLAANGLGQNGLTAAAIRANTG